MERKFFKSVTARIFFFFFELENNKVSQLVDGFSFISLKMFHHPNNLQLFSSTFWWGGCCIFTTLIPRA